MISDVASDKELFRNLMLLSNEVKQIQKSLRTIDSHESRLRAALDELALEKEILSEQANRFEAIITQAATSALQDAEWERERQQSLESEKSALTIQIKEMEQTLQSKETAVTELQEEFIAGMEDLKGQIREKDRLLQIREIALTDLKAAAETLNRLVSGLSSSGETPMLLLDESQDNPTEDTTDMIKEFEDRTSFNIERLKSDSREKDFTLSAKSVEIESTRQTMSGGDDLEKALDAKRKRKSPRLASLLADMGGKRFM
jgi:hypothetical protein